MKKVAVPVISIGNIVAGGTGKTPLVCMLTNELCENKGAIAILTRGYRSYLEEASHSQLISSGSGPLTSVKECGDEAFWLALTTYAAIWVGKDRVQSAKKAIKHHAKLLILEDGFQHRRMHRDIDIVLLDAEDPFGKGFFLPRGLLRDSPLRLERADWIIINNLKDKTQFENIKTQISGFTKAPIIGLAPVYELESYWKGKKVGAFCGIAKPSRFYKALEEMGCTIVKQISTADHTIPSLDKLQLFAQESADLGAEALVCTEKDLVKLSAQIDQVQLPIVPLKMQLTCVQNENLWQEMLESIKTIM